MRIPHNRKWPIYTMPVGSSFTVEKTTPYTRRGLYHRAAMHGIVLNIRRFNGKDPASGFVVTRLA